jgi:hypothetical protein
VLPFPFLQLVAALALLIPLVHLAVQAVAVDRLIWRVAAVQAVKAIKLGRVVILVLFPLVAVAVDQVLLVLMEIQT